MNGSTQANYHHSRQRNIGEMNSSSIYVCVSSIVSRVLKVDAAVVKRLGDYLSTLQIRQQADDEGMGVGDER
jgi:hypothetical protein